MAVKLNIDHSAVVRLTNKLEKLHRSDLPIAIRSTLNEAAFNTKKHIPAEAEKHFVTRTRTFFRAFSKVDPAKGFDVDQMRAIVGMVDARPGGKSEQAGRNMTQRQVGGTIGGRAFIPTEGARVGKTTSGKVSPRFRLGNLNLTALVDSSVNQSGTEKQRFIRTAIYAFKNFGKGALIRHTGRDGTTRIYRIQNVKSRGRVSINAQVIYTYKRGRSVQAGKVVPFVFLAARKEARKINAIFEKQAKRRINKLS